LSLLEHVALRAEATLFVSRGAWAIGDRRSVLAGQPATGATSLLAALLGDGATLYAEQYVPIRPAPGQGISIRLRRTSVRD